MLFEVPRFYRLPRGQEITIQKITPEAAVAAIGLFRAAYRDAYAGHRALRTGQPYVIQPEDAEGLYRPDDPHMIKEWREDFLRPTTLDGKRNVLRLAAYSRTRALLGYAAIVYSQIPNAVSCAANQDDHSLTAELDEIDVAREARRSPDGSPSQGVGTALMHATSSFLSDMHRPAESIGLTVAPENTARGWYERLSFSPSGHHMMATWPGDKDIRIPLIEMTTNLGDLQAVLTQRYPWLATEPQQDQLSQSTA